MGGLSQYVGRVGKIYVVPLAAVDEWEQVLAPSEAKGIRGFKIKSRIVYDSSGNPTHPPRPFDYAFVSSPASGADTNGNGFYSNSGAGSGDEGGPANGIWARSPVSGCVLEVLVYE